MLAVALVVLGVVMRLLPHTANFAPIAAIALFGAVYLKRRYALILPVVALLISDIFIGFDSLQSRLTVYGSFMLVGLLGLAIRKRKNVATIIGGSLAGSIIFYLITNFAYFYPPTMYPHNLAGVVSSYYNALPFFRNTLLGDLFYTGLLFGLYELAVYINKNRGKSVTRAINTV
ncbi:MAG TPA: DUF6580 family putative transport protein [Candidatus Saccharimonadales bacterium]|nr:DUF6580 family putative transport protein [Candidatus Saccharimonadales bacterium]